MAELLNTKKDVNKIGWCFDIWNGSSEVQHYFSCNFILIVIGLIVAIRIHALITLSDNFSCLPHNAYMHNVLNVVVFILGKIN